MARPDARLRGGDPPVARAAVPVAPVLHRRPGHEERGHDRHRELDARPRAERPRRGVDHRRIDHRGVDHRRVDHARGVDRARCVDGAGRVDRRLVVAGIAAAPDFTEDLIWQPLDDDQRNKMKNDGQIAMENPYADDPVIYPYHLIEDGRQHLRLRAPLAITAPVRLLQGMNDTEVPWQTATRLADCLQSDDVVLHFDKTATHRFSEPSQLQLLETVLVTLLDQLDPK